MSYTTEHAAIDEPPAHTPHASGDPLGWWALGGALFVLLLAIIPQPVYLITAVTAAVTAGVGTAALLRGVSSGGAVGAHGLAGLAISVVALAIALTFFATAPDAVAEPPAYVPPPVTETVAEATADPVPEIVRLAPVSVAATSTAASSTDDNGNVVTFAAGNVLDQDPATAWRTPGAAVDVSLIFEFGQQVHLTSVAMVPGYAKADPKTGVDRFAENRRVRQARFDFSDEVYEYTDSPVMQSNNVDADVTSVQMTIVSSTPRTTRDFTAISEIEFYGWVVG